MSRIRGQGLNKEKLVFLLCSLLLALCAFGYLSDPREDLLVGRVLTAKGRPSEYQDIYSPVKENVNFFLDPPLRDRKSPFTPSTKFGVGGTQPVTKPNPGQPPPPPPSQEDLKPPSSNSNPKTALEKNLEVAFMGVIMIGDKSYALLRSKDGSPPRRVKEGDTLEGLNYKIDKIEKQSIYLTDAEGTPYVLKDGRFAEAGTSSTQVVTAQKAPDVSQPPQKSPAISKPPDNSTPKPTQQDKTGKGPKQPSKKPRK